MARRVREALRRVLATTPSGRVVLVTHRTPIAAAASLCERGGAVATGGCPNGSFTVVERRAGDRRRLVAWADARHLDDR